MFSVTLFYICFKDISCFPDNLTRSRAANSIQIGLSEGSSYNVTEQTHQQQLMRIQHLHRACKDETVFKNAMYKKSGNGLYYYSSKYEFNYCKVPKAGCSFWMQIFAILRKGSNASEEVFSLARSSVHGARGEARFKSKAKITSRTVLASRDPYSRLFSAFIDKLFLPISYPISLEIAQRQRKTKLSCANDVTFEEYLKDTVEIARNRQGGIHTHWAPIVTICNPCNVNAFALVKQETFSADVEYVLKEVGVADDEYNVIYEALHNRRIDDTIASLVKEVTGKNVERCMDRIEVARRIWKAFQIQGYIKDGITFPTQTINKNENAKNSSFLSKVILETIRQNPMSKNDAKLQRRRALVKAFDGLSKDILDQLKEVYKQDFILFDYSPEPPSM